MDQDHGVLRDQVVLQERVGPPEQPVKSAPRVLWDLLDSLGLADSRDKMVNQERQGLQDLPDPREWLVLQDLLV